MKLSDSPAKTPNPGDKGAWRLYDRRNRATADLIGTRDERPGEMEEIVLHHPNEPGSRRRLARRNLHEIEALLVDTVAEGRALGAQPDLEEIRRVRRADMERLDPGVKRLVNPHIYHVSLTEKLWGVKQQLMAAMRAGLPDRSAE
jgi:nicotinate phosphoribosyltransferase